MTPQDLKELLFAHSAGEERNHRGESFSFGQYAEAGRANGRIRLPFYGAEYGSHASIDAGPGIIVKKNSRFQSVPTHTHEWIELNYVYAGSIEQCIGGRTHVLQTHQVSLIDVDTPHALGYAGEGDILINLLIPPTILDLQFFARMSSQGLVTRFFVDSIQHRTRSDHYLIFPTQDDERLARYMELFLCEYREAHADSHDVLQSLFFLILTQMVRSLEQAEATSADSPDEEVVAVLRYLEEHADSCTLRQTASEFGLSPNYLTALLKEKTGSSYKELVLQRRMTMAANLLRATDLPVDEIARQVGYSNASFFYRKFRAAYGVTPAAWRQCR